MGHGGDAVLDVDGHGLSELDVLDALDGRDEVERDLAVVDADVLGVEVALVEGIVVAVDAGLQVLLHLESAVDDERAAGLDELGVVAERLEIGLLGAVDVEVVRVGGGDDGHPRGQPVERTVELVGLDDHEV